MIPNIVAMVLMLVSSSIGFFLKTTCKVNSAVFAQKSLRLIFWLILIDFALGLILTMLYLSNSEASEIIFTLVILIVTDGIQIALIYLFYKQAVVCYNVLR